ncbi:MAG: hypothetical protein WA162_07600 [Thermodesulfobacteriota bacterium]
MKIKTAFIIFLIFPAWLFAGAGWTGVAEDIEGALKDALKTYELGETEKAMEEVADAYFAIFEAEDANMEIAVRQRLSLKRATSLERVFTDVRKMMHEKAPFKVVKERTLDLTAEIKKAAGELDAKGVDIGNRR